MIPGRALGTVVPLLLALSCSDGSDTPQRPASSADVLDVLMNEAPPRGAKGQSTRASVTALVAPEKWRHMISFRFNGRDRSWTALFRKPQAPGVSPAGLSDPTTTPVVDHVRGTAIVASWSREGPDWVIPVGTLDREFVLAFDVCPLRLNLHASWSLGLFAQDSNPESRDLYVRFECRSSGKLEVAHFEAGVYADLDREAALNRNSQNRATEYLCGHWYRVLLHGEPDTRRPGWTRIRARIAPSNEDALPSLLEVDDSIPASVGSGPMVLGCYRPGPEPEGKDIQTCVAELDNLFFGWNAEIVPEATAVQPTFDSGTWSVASWPPPGQ